MPPKRTTKLVVISSLLVFLCALVTGYDIPQPTIEKNIGYVNDTNVYLAVEPYTLTHSGYVVYSFQSKTFTGDIDLLFGFDKETATPKTAELLRTNVSITRNLTCDTTQTGVYYIVNTTRKEVTCLYNETLSNGTRTDVIWKHYYDSVNQTTKTIFWTEVIQELWTKLGGFDKEIRTLNKWDTFYINKGLTITANKTYKLRVAIDIPFNQGSNKGEYIVALKRSSQTLQQAIDSNTLYVLDPWFDYAYNWRIYINCSNITTKSTPIVFNGTSGVTLNGSVQFIWGRCEENLYVYYNNFDNYTIANATSIVPYEVEKGNETSWLPVEVWGADYKLVLHGDCVKYGNDSSQANNDATCSGANCPATTTAGYVGCAFSPSGDGFIIPYVAASMGFNDYLTIEYYDKRTDATPNTQCVVKSRTGNTGFMIYEDEAGTGYNNMTIFYTGKAAWGGEESADQSVKSGRWNILTMAYDTGVGRKIYSNGSLLTSDTTTNQFGTSGAQWNLFSNDGISGDGFDGLIDEFRISNVTKTQTDITYKANNLRNLDGFGNALAGEAFTPTSVTFISQTPADISSTSMFSARALIIYNISAGTNAPINNATIYIAYKTNSTATDCLRNINGSLYCGWRNTSYDAATSDLYNFSLGDAKVYPYTENLDFQTYFRNIEHSGTQLNTSNDYVKIQLLNVSNSKLYGYFEIDVNATNNLTIPIYYCNYSYDNTSNPASTPNCAIFGTILNVNNFNHTHNTSVTNSSRHHVLSFAVNQTTKTIAGVGVTPISYFLVRGQSAQTIELWKVNNVSRTDAIQVSSNNGNSWANKAYTIDAHLHQFDDNDTLYYYVCANDSVNQTCSSTQTDSLNLTNLPPTAPFVYSPVAAQYDTDTFMDINYTAATSPNGYAIVQYNISLYTTNYTYISTITDNNSINLNYSWNNTGLLGNYTIGVWACDNMSQCSIGFSDIFEVVRASAPSEWLNVALNEPVDTANITSGNNINLNYTTTGTNQTYNCSINFNGSASNQTAADILNNTKSSFNYTGLGNGTYYWNVTCSLDISTFNVSPTYSFEINYPTRPTTTTTTTPTSTTSTTYPDTTEGINPILYIYAIMIPCFAVVFTLASCHFTKQPLCPIMATILWYASSLWTINIKFIFDFTTAFRPYYVDIGNPEVGTLFLAMASIMGIYSVMIILNQAASVGWLMRGGKKNG